MQMVGDFIVLEGVSVREQELQVVHAECMTYIDTFYEIVNFCQGFIMYSICVIC